MMARDGGNKDGEWLDDCAEPGSDIDVRKVERREEKGDNYFYITTQGLKYLMERVPQGMITNTTAEAFPQSLRKGGWTDTEELRKGSLERALTDYVLTLPEIKNLDSDRYEEIRKELKDVFEGRYVRPYIGR